VCPKNSALSAGTSTLARPSGAYCGERNSGEWAGARAEQALPSAYRDRVTNHEVRDGEEVSLSKALAVVLLLVALILVGVGWAAPTKTRALHRAAAATDLTIRAVNTSVGRAVFHVRCTPAGGDLPHPMRVCAALATDPQLITNPRPFKCPGGPFSGWDITITGRLDRQPIKRVFSTCWTPQMTTLGRLGMSWQVLQKHLLPRRHEAVLAGTTHVFPPGALRPADLITCDIRGHQLEIGVPTIAGRAASTGYGGKNVVRVSLEVTRHADGSVTATCSVVR